MNILAFDTCFDACSVAARRGDGGSVAAAREMMRRGHAEALVPMIERTMDAAGLGFADLDRIAVTHGPGTFTGTRVGLSAALGFAVAHDLPVVTYSSLQCVARAAIAWLGDAVDAYDGVLVARDAKRDSVFVEVTDRTGNEAVAPALLALGDAQRLADGRRWLAIGSGVPLLTAAGATLHEPGVDGPAGPCPADLTEPDARYLLADAATREPATKPAPLYLRPPDATPSTRPPLARQASGKPSDV